VVHTHAFGTQQHAMFEEDDPLHVFDEKPSDACLGEWKNERLNVRITSQEGRYILESGQRELVLTSLEHNVWSVALVSEPDTELYVAEVTGHGTDLRLLLRQPKHKSGSSKTAVLWKDGEGSGELGALPPLSIPPFVTAPREERIREQRVHKREGRGHGRRREERGRRKDRSGGHHARSKSRTPSPPWRHRSHSRQRTPRRWSPRGGKRDKGLGKGEEVSTLFVTGLPDDAREDEIRMDLEREGTVLRVVMMRRGGEVNAFVRFETLADATRVMNALMDGTLKVCQSRLKAEIARRNTN